MHRVASSPQIHVGRKDAAWTGGEEAVVVSKLTKTSSGVIVETFERPFSVTFQTHEARGGVG